MDTNSVLRSLRYILNIDDNRMAEIFSSAGKSVEATNVRCMLKNDDDSNYLVCSDDLLVQFLDNLIVIKRGPKDPSKPEPPKESLTNNLILKKIRIAFNLKEDDMLKTFSKGGFEITKPEMSALFRRKGHRHYKECGDQIMRKFLKGLSLKD